MNKKERIALIRKGNEFFNKGEIDKAIKIFVQTGYKDGLIRVADYYYYDKRMPLIAYKFYKMANMDDKVNEIFTRMISVLGKWIGEDKLKDDVPHHRKEYSPRKISPKLKILAEEILREEDKKEDSGHKNNN